MSSNESEVRPILHIIRGLPGSGKTTLAHQLKGFYLCADDLRYVGEEYIWEKGDNQPYQLLDAIFLRVMSQRDCDIVLDAVFTQKNHFAWYLEKAKQHDYEVQIHFPKTEWAWNVDVCFTKTPHNVPLETIQRMADSFEQ